MEKEERSERGRFTTSAAVGHGTAGEGNGTRIERLEEQRIYFGKREKDSERGIRTSIAQAPTKATMTATTFTVS